MAYPCMFYHFLFESFLFVANAWDLEPPTRGSRGKTFRPRCCSYYGGTDGAHAPNRSLAECLPTMAPGVFICVIWVYVW